MKKILLFLGLFISVLSVNAEDNVLQTIEIVPVKDTYNIVLVSDKAVDVKKTVKASNQITLNMKDIRASKTLNTVYNNVSNVDTVMVEPQGNGISIFFQAENAEAASVSFDSLAPIMPKKSQSQKITLNSPIESYAPIYREELVTQPKSYNLVNRIKKSSKVEGIRDSIEGGEVAETANKTFSFGLIALLVFGFVKLLRRKEPEMKIGLGQSMREREMEMYRNSQPIGTTYANPEKPFTTVNYGLNAYQRENRNSFEEAPIHNPRLRNYVNPAPVKYEQVQTVSQPQRQNVQTAVKPMAKRNTTPVNTAPVNQGNPNIDNLKFLESMTAIYEKSGRHDLARGLKASLNKNNIKV